MTEPDRGTDRAARRSKRFLTPMHKYEIGTWAQLAASTGPRARSAGGRWWAGRSN